MEEILKLIRDETNQKKKIALWHKYKVDIFEWMIKNIDKAYEEERKNKE